MFYFFVDNVMSNSTGGRSVADVANGSHTGEIRCNLSKKYHSCSFGNIKDINNIQMILVAISHNMCKISGKQEF